MVVLALKRFFGRIARKRVAGDVSKSEAKSMVVRAVAVGWMNDSYLLSMYPSIKTAQNNEL